MFIKNQNVQVKKAESNSKRFTCDKWVGPMHLSQINHHLQGYLESLQIEIYRSWNRQFKSRFLLNILVLFVLSNTQTLLKRSCLSLKYMYNSIIYIYISTYIFVPTQTNHFSWPLKHIPKPANHQDMGFPTARQSSGWQAPMWMEEYYFASVVDSLVFCGMARSIPNPTAIRYFLLEIL